MKIKPHNLVKTSIALAVVNACLNQPVYAQETSTEDDSIRIKKIVTANRHA